MRDQREALKKLGLTDEEVAEVLETDRRIDKGEKLFDLPKELEKGAKKARNAGNCTGYTKTARVKKIDEDKKHLISLLFDGVNDNTMADNFQVVNAEREFTFEYKGRKFKVVLSCPRS
jgi:hypothetical protein